MSVYDLLTTEDLSLIEKYMHTYGGYGGDYLESLCDIKHLLRFWDGAKTGFLSSLMGNKLIVERELNVKTPEFIITQQLNQLLYNTNGVESHRFVSHFYHFINSLDWPYYKNLQTLMTTEVLLDNIYQGETFELPIPGKEHGLKINKGCKVMKILGKLSQIFKIEDFEDFRLKHSMILNQKEFKGTLCLSIHPMDYMTMSDNDCNWDSCMSWQKPGEYREGTIEMMNSPYVLVAYLKAEKDMKVFPNTDWNNKRWRKLYVASPDVITGIKGYPYQDKILEKEVFKILMELVSINCPWCNYDAPIIYDPGEYFEYRDTNIKVNYEFGIMYNDFFSDHIGYFSPTILQKIDKWNTYMLILSGATMCLSCGCAYDDDLAYWDSQSFCCPDCTGEVRCSHCNEVVYEEDAYTMPNGDVLCPYCLDAYTCICDFCETNHYREDVSKIYLSHNGDIYMDEYLTFCDDCLDNAINNRAFGFIKRVPHPHSKWHPDIYILESETMTLAGFHAFGYYAKTIEKARAQLD